MIPSEQEKIFWILYLITEEKANSFDRLFTAIDVISQEEIVGFRRETSIFENSQEVVILAMDITYKQQVIISNLPPRFN